MPGQLLVLQDPAAELAIHNGLFEIRKRGKVIMTTRPEDVAQVFVQGAARLSSKACEFILRQGIDTVFLSWNGVYLGRLESDRSAYVELRRTQYARLADSEVALSLARSVVRGKLQNARIVLRRVLKNDPDDLVKRTIATLRRTLVAIDGVRDIEVLRGHEGAAAAAYFDCFPRLVRNPDFVFHHRTRRPPRDPFNALLSFCYMNLLTVIKTAVCIVGLEPGYGALHEIKRNRPSLALDLLEEYRPILDREVLNLVNRKAIQLYDFSIQDDWTEIDYSYGELPVRLTPTGQKKAYLLLKNLKDSRHLWHDEKVYRLEDIIINQARLLARYLEGRGEDCYHPFILER